MPTLYIYFFLNLFYENVIDIKGYLAWTIPQNATFVEDSEPRCDHLFACCRQGLLNIQGQTGSSRTNLINVTFFISIIF